MLIPNKHSGYKAGIRLYPGGKGGSSAPPPDPALIAAQIKSMGIQDGAIEAILRNANEMLPMQKEQMQFGLDTSRAAYDQSQQDRTWMLNRRGSLSGLQDTLVKDASNFNEAGKANELAGKAMADVGSGFSNAEAQQQRSMARMGINPSSGRSLAMGNQTAIAKASALAGAASGARTQAEAQKYALTDRATNALAGYPAMGMQATGSGQGFGAAGLGLANQGLAGMNSGYGAAGGIAGQMGQNASNMFGAQASYKNKQDQIANQPDPMMSLIGGAATKWMMSDVNQKEAIDPLAPGEALDKVSAIPSSEWQYKGNSPAADGGKRHIGPMAQDVQRVVGEDAAPGGKAIDLVSLNGLNMAATKDLNTKVDQLAQEVRRLSVGGIKGANHG